MTAHNQYNAPWTKEEMQWLREVYPFANRSQVMEWAKDHKRTIRAIVNKASYEGIKKVKKEKEIPIFPPKIQKKISEVNNSLLLFETQKKPLLVSKNTKIVIGGDNHIPFNDVRAENEFLAFLKEEKPEIVIHVGDLLDFYEISNFRRVPLTQTEIVDEIEEGTYFLEKIRNILPKAKIFYICGNHEFRFQKYLIDNAFVFYKVFALSLPELLRLKQLGVNFVPLRIQANKFSHNFIQINDILIGHFDKSLQNAGYTARWLRDFFGKSIITGHTHRLAITYKNFYNETKFGVEAGCLCNLEPSYVTSPDWAQGFVELRFENNKWQVFCWRI